MTSFDRTWLGGWIAFCLGVAHNNLSLKIVGMCMFVLALLLPKRSGQRR